MVLLGLVNTIGIQELPLLQLPQPQLVIIVYLLWMEMDVLEHQIQLLLAYHLKQLRQLQQAIRFVMDLLLHVNNLIHE